jgi:hypothetical protein
MALFKKIVTEKRLRRAFKEYKTLLTKVIKISENPVTKNVPLFRAGRFNVVIVYVAGRVQGSFDSLTFS